MKFKIMLTIIILAITILTGCKGSIQTSSSNSDDRILYSATYPKCSNCGMLDIGIMIAPQSDTVILIVYYCNNCKNIFSVEQSSIKPKPKGKTK